MFKMSSHTAALDADDRFTARTFIFYFQCDTQSSMEISDIFDSDRVEACDSKKQTLNYLFVQRSIIFLS